MVDLAADEIEAPLSPSGELGHMDSILKCLRETGFTVDVACQAFHAITLHVVGSTLGKLDFPFDAEELPDLASNFLKQMPTEEYPYFAEHVMHHIEATDHPGSFEFVLDLILKEIDRAGGTRPDKTYLTGTRRST